MAAAQICLNVVLFTEQPARPESVCQWVDKTKESYVKVKWFYFKYGIPYWERSSRYRIDANSNSATELVHASVENADLVIIDPRIWEITITKFILPCTNQPRIAVLYISSPLEHLLRPADFMQHFTRGKSYSRNVQPTVLFGASIIYLVGDSVTIAGKWFTDGRGIINIPANGVSPDILLDALHKRRALANGPLVDHSSSGSLEMTSSYPGGLVPQIASSSASAPAPSVPAVAPAIDDMAWVDWSEWCTTMKRLADIGRKTASADMAQARERMYRETRYEGTPAPSSVLNYETITDEVLSKCIAEAKAAHTNMLQAGREFAPYCAEYKKLVSILTENIVRTHDVLKKLVSVTASARVKGSACSDATKKHADAKATTNKVRVALSALREKELKLQQDLARAREHVKTMIVDGERTADMVWAARAELDVDEAALQVALMEGGHVISKEAACPGANVTDRNQSVSAPTPVPDGPSQPAAVEDAKLCVVCLDAPRAMLIVPCGHKCLCKTCSAILVARADTEKCPICRARVSQYIEVFDV